MTWNQVRKAVGLVMSKTGLQVQESPLYGRRYGDIVDANINTYCLWTGKAVSRPGCNTCLPCLMRKRVAVSLRKLRAEVARWKGGRYYGVES